MMHPNDGLCDFCSDPHPVHVFDAQNIAVGVLVSQEASETLVSAGAWGACAVCADLIERDDRKGLEDRAVTAMSNTLPGMPADLLRAAVQGSHAAFFRGHAEALEPR